MATEAKPFASLSSGLLARKGAARPAMRPQGFGQVGNGLEDLGWNDMGFEPPKSNTVAKSDLAPINPSHGKGTGILGTLPANAMASAEPVRPVVAAAAPQQVASAAPAPIAVAAPPAPKAAEAPKPSVRPGSWIIQVGALESEAEAKSRLNEARDAARTTLGKAEPFTEAVAKGNQQLYRARFAGFVDKDNAEAVCKTLKRSDVPCFAMKY